MVIDMDLPPSERPSRVPSPEPPVPVAVAQQPRWAAPSSGTPGQPVSPQQQQHQPSSASAAGNKKTGLGSLMQAAKQDAKQGAQEFSMEAFGF